jgi:hypothetical protein
MATSWTAKLDTDFKEPLTLKDSAGVVFDLTGHTLSAEVRSQDGTDGKLEATATVTPVTPPGADGLVDVELTDTQVNTLGLGRHFVDVKVVRTSDSYKFRSEDIATLTVEERITA